MAGQADGSIIIDTELDSKGFKAGSAELLSAIKSLTGRVEKLQKQMQKVGQQKIASDEYKQVQQDIAQAEKYLAQYNQRLAKLSEKGKVNTAEWKALTADIKAASAELSRLRTLKAAMEQNGTAYISGTQTAQYQSMNAALVSSKQQLAEMQAELARVNSRWAQMPTLTGYVRSSIQRIGSAIKSTLGTAGTAILHPLQAADRVFGVLLQKAGQFVRIMGKSGVSGLVSGLKAASSYMTRITKQSKLMKRPLESMSFLLRRIAPSLLMTEGVFGLLRKAVNAFLQENEQLAANLSACWSGIGNVLGPIISRLISLVSTAIAYVTAFLRLLGFVGKSTTKAISSAGGGAKKETEKLKRQLAAFDELNILQNKDEDDSGGGGGGGSIEAETPEVTLPDWVELIADNLKAGKWAEAATVLTDQLNLMVDNVDWSGIGSKIAYWTDAVLEFLATAILTFDWYNLGVGLGEMINSLIYGVDWANLGVVLGAKFIILFEGLGGLFATIDWVALGTVLSDCFMGLWNAIDWAQAGRTISDGVIGIATALSTAIINIDWQKIGSDVATCISNIDWSGVLTALSKGIGAALGGLAGLLWGFAKDELKEFADKLVENTERCGGDAVAGFLLGIWDAICDIGSWIKDNIFTPFIEGFKAAFGINSPSTVMQEQGGYIVAGLLLGLQEAWGDLLGWIGDVFDGLTDTISSWASDAKQTIKDWASNTKTSITTWASDTKSNIANWASNTYTTISSKVSSIKSTISSGFNAAKTSITSSLQSAMSTIKGQDWYSVGSNICTGIGNGINAGWNWLKSKVSSLAQNLLSAAKSALGIHSPSRLFRDAVGLNIGYGVGEGIEAAEGSVLDSVVGVADAIAHEFNANEYSIGSVVSNTDMDSALTAFSDKIADSFAGLMDRLQAIANSASFITPRAALGAVVPYTAQAEYNGKTGGESPEHLHTLVEAIAAELIPAMMAGFEAVVSEQQSTREMIGEIEIGDTVIGQAANRYNRKMAVVNGGL